jgi:hypothetical protein
MEKRMWQILLGDAGALITSSVMLLFYPARCYPVILHTVLFKIKHELPVLFPSF